MSDLPSKQTSNGPRGHFVYIVQCANGTLYTGYTTNVQKRIVAHNNGKGARYTRAHRPVTLLASWPFADRSSALRAEYAVKQLSRTRKMELLTLLSEDISCYIKEPHNKPAP